MVRTKDGGGLIEDSAPVLVPGVPSPAKQPAPLGAERLHGLLLKANKELSLYTRGKRLRIGNLYRS